MYFSERCVALIVQRNRYAQSNSRHILGASKRSDNLYSLQVVVHIQVHDSSDSFVEGLLWTKLNFGAEVCFFVVTVRPVRKKLCRMQRSYLVRSSELSPRAIQQTTSSSDSQLIRHLLKKMGSKNPADAAVRNGPTGARCPWKAPNPVFPQSAD